MVSLRFDVRAVERLRVGETKGVRIAVSHQQQTAWIWFIDVVNKSADEFA